MMTPEYKAALIWQTKEIKKMLHMEDDVPMTYYDAKHELLNNIATTDRLLTAIMGAYDTFREHDDIAALLDQAYKKWRAMLTPPTAEEMDMMCKEQEK